MQCLPELPLPLPTGSGKAVALVAPEGPARRALLSTWLLMAREKGYEGWGLDCDFAHGGPWAGLADLLGSFLPSLQAIAPDLVTRHDYEIVTVLPRMNKVIPVRHLSLTDQASVQEQTRLYPPDRALRIVHGLIELLAEWKARTTNSPWLLICDNFDRAGYLTHTFFSELLRRRGTFLGAPLLLVTSDGETSLATEQLVQSSVEIPLEVEPEAASDPEEAFLRARQLEAECSGDLDLEEDNYSKLIAAWTQAGDYEKAFFWRTESFSRYTMRGYYRDALVHGKAALQFIREHLADDERKRTSVVNKLYSCYCGIGEPYEALRVIEEEALPTLTNKEYRAHFHYQLAMLYTRFLPESDRDLSKSEASLEQGLSDLLAAEIPLERKQFLITFNRNAMALVRHRQRSHQEAIKLCREGYERLMKYLGNEQHRLHRSVLLYNIAQVYATIDRPDDALYHFNAAIALDTSYSEYYNERGNIYFRLGRLQEALTDYRQAVELSPPYPEVFVNMGQCLRALGLFNEALASYGRALDIKPDQPWVLVMRAECHEALGKLEEALADYTGALALDPSQFAVLANRACLYFALGDPRRACTDLDRAIEISPNTPELYENRASALYGLGLKEQAIQDLERYLALSPGAPDFQEVTTRIVELRRLPPQNVLPPTAASQAVL